MIARRTAESALSRHRKDWEQLAVDDPLWAVSGKRDTAHAPWTVGDFIATGQVEVDHVLETAASFGLPKRRELALDFGCGVGRTTRALADRFERCEAVDISEGMLVHARQLNSDLANCCFRVNDRADLGMFESETFDVVYSSFVLQHLPSTAMAAGYIREFIRVARPGGLVVFQMPDHLPWRHRLQLRRRLRVHPVRMIALSRGAIEDIVERSGGSVQFAEPVDATEPIAGYRYYVAPS